LDFDKIEAANFVDEMADELLNKYEDE